MGGSSTRGARRRGRPPQITRDDVAEAAGRLGPKGLTVQAVADALGVTRAAIYHYVEDVEELRRVAAYARVPEFADLADEERSWQDWLRAYAHATRAWRLSIDEPYLDLSFDMPEVDWFLVVADKAIDVLVGAGFEERRARHAFQLLCGVVWINAQDELNSRRAPRERPPLRHFPRDPEALPHLPHIRSAISDRTWYGDPTDRFQRELNWAILALETELGLTGSTDRDG